MGKSTLVKSIIARYPDEVGGFTTQEVLEDGERRGFKVITVDGKSAILADVDIVSNVRVSRYGVDVSVIEKVCIPAIEDALKNKKIIVIDEIGNMQICSPEFQKLLLSALDSNKVIVATIHVHNHPFTDEIKKRPDVQLVALTADNRESVEKELTQQLV